ncbi:transcriptional regulator [Listeriaceae bacterium FSL A5-0209]|nr:transcriptional regulator [Listeriaceae bacterium FSL A5-0209]
MLYNTIKRMADEQNISIYRIEKDSGMANGTIGKWGRTANQKPTAENLKKVADYFGVSMEELINTEEDITN